MERPLQTGAERPVRAETERRQDAPTRHASTACHTVPRSCSSGSSSDATCGRIFADSRPCFVIHPRFVTSSLGRCARSSLACETLASRTQSGTRCAGSFTFSERWRLGRAVPSSTLDRASALESPGSLTANPLSGVESAATSPENATSQADVAGADAQRQANGPGNGILGTLPLPGGVDGRPAWVMILLDVVLWFCILALVAIFLSPFRRAFR